MEEQIKSFEKYLEENLKNGTIDFTIRASMGKDGIEFYIHPEGKDGKTLDFWVEGNLLISRNKYEGLINIIKERKN